jgi:hypothetical protein
VPPGAVDHKEEAGVTTSTVLDRRGDEHAFTGDEPSQVASARSTAGVDLYWLPLGAGGHSVRLNGKVFEWFAARLEHRKRRDLYHSALQVYVPEGRFVIEQAPAWGEGSQRGVIAEGAVGARALGRFRLFRYEVRRWREGVIPDIAEAVESPQRLSDEPQVAQRLLELVPAVPTPVWARDELGAGEMWNSNSIISWLLARSGLDVESIPLPRGGRAPGWNAGIAIARRELAGRAPCLPRGTASRHSTTEAQTERRDRDDPDGAGLAPHRAQDDPRDRAAGRAARCPEEGTHPCLSRDSS